MDYDFNYLDSGILLKQALEYAAKGMKVFPCVPCYNVGEGAGKIPLTTNGFKQATTDRDTIEKWWRLNPRANVGMATGEAADLLVIDVDIKPGNDGATSLHALEEKYGKLPATLTATTGSGGKHYFFKYPAGHTIKNSASIVAPWVDIRANGGYVVVAPSMHACGKAYAWDKPLQQRAELPAAWITMIETAKGKKVPTTRKQPAAKKKAAATPAGELAFDATISDDGHTPFVLPETIPESGRNNTLCSYAGQLWARGVDVEHIQAAVLKANEERCKPPLEEREVLTIVRSITTNYEQGNPVQRVAFEQTAGIVSPADLSESGNADAFIATYGKDLLFTGETLQRGAWYHWDGKRYTPSWQKVRELAKGYGLQLLELAQKQLREAAASNMDTKPFQLLERFALQTRSNKGITNMLQLAASKVFIREQAFDADPWILNTPGGMVDLRTGDLLEHDRAQHCRCITVADPSKATEEASSGAASKWPAFINLITAGDTELAHYLQVVMGSALIGKPLFEGFFIAYGEGGHGKSTFFNAIAKALGRDYSGTIDPEVFTVGYKRDRLNGIMPLIGKRLVVAQETDELTHLSSATTKRAASTDAMPGKSLYHDPGTFDPSHTLFMCTNHLPIVSSTDNGTWRRLRILPFEVAMPGGKEGIADYAAVLADEAGATVLQWCIDGAVDFVQHGCRLPDCTAVEIATREWRNMSDVVAQFAAEQLEITGMENDKISASLMHANHVEWCHKNGKIAASWTTLFERLENLGICRQMAGRNIVFTGVKFTQN